MVGPESKDIMVQFLAQIMAQFLLIKAMDVMGEVNQAGYSPLGLGFLQWAHPKNHLSSNLRKNRTQHLIY